MHRVDTVENSPGVRWELADGIESLPGWRKGVRQKKTETHRKIFEGLTMTGAMKLQPDDGPRSSLGIVPGFGRCSGISLEFARRFAEWIGKLAGNTLGDRRKKTERLATRMSEGAGLVGLPRSVGFDIHPKKISSGRRCASRRRAQEWT
ncbi:hypothetical protein BHE74_00052326 [Ensete ventricosum]|nr:hypothetical protein BHE74_00052326 [Ensete ventricosum]